MKTRILFVIDNLQFGGGERVFSQIINGLNPEKYRIFLASQPGEEFYQSIHNEQVRFVSLDFSKRVKPYLIIRLAKIIKKNRIDIVHGQGARTEFYARTAHRLAGNSKYISTIAMPVEGFDIGSAKKKIYRFFDSFSERFVDRFIVVSDSLNNKMIIERGINSEKVLRIYNGIEPDQYSYKDNDGSRLKIRKEFTIDDDTYLIGAVGRLVWQKGLEYLIQAIPDVINVYPNVKLLIVGDGPLKERLKAQASSLKVFNHLIFAGFRRDIKEILSAIDILVIPSLLEGFPMITLEGMAMARPIIATQISGINEQIIDGETGLLVSPREAYALAKAVFYLLENKRFASNLGLNARKIVESNFSIDKMIANTEKTYRALLEPHIRQ